MASYCSASFSTLSPMICGYLTHGVFFFCVSEYPLDFLFSLFVQKAPKSELCLYAKLIYPFGQRGFDIPNHVSNDIDLSTVSVKIV